MFGIVNAPHYIGQFEMTSSESGDSIAEVDSRNLSDDDELELSGDIGMFNLFSSFRR